MVPDDKPLDFDAPDSDQQPAAPSFGDQLSAPPFFPEASAEYNPNEERPQTTPQDFIEQAETPIQAQSEQPPDDFHVYNQTPRTTPPANNPIHESPEPSKPKLTETDLLRERLRRDPLDVSTRQHLIGLAEASGDVDRIQDAYEGLLEIFPNAVRNNNTLV
jgi:hypothetical protein